VMNTDNMSALGLTIDYGPYGWLEPFDPDWTPNTTDAQGRRYRFGNQPAIGQWNLARLCEALHPLIQDEARLRQVLSIYVEVFEKEQAQVFAGKLGLSSIESETGTQLMEELFALMRECEADYILFFRSLCNFEPESPGQLFDRVSTSFYSTDLIVAPLKERWDRWAESYSALLKSEGSENATRSAAMKRVNPKYVLRNYLAQEAIQAAEAADLSKLERLMRVLKTPYDELPGENDLAAKRPEWARNAPGCSALSCSS
jgi:serine/tyrosine/threonine adenylyltransferase